MESYYAPMDVPPEGLYAAFAGSDEPPAESQETCPYSWACEKSASRLLDGLTANGIVELLELQIEGRSQCNTCPLDETIRAGLELPTNDE